MSDESCRKGRRRAVGEVITTLYGEKRKEPSTAGGFSAVQLVEEALLHAVLWGDEQIVADVSCFWRGVAIGGWFCGHVWLQSPAIGL